MNQTINKLRVKMCDLSEHMSYRELKPPEVLRGSLQTDCVPLEVIKQKTPEWFDARKTTKVTGSVAHKALGLESLNKQTKHFNIV
ncbi:hypothetical protein DPMN_187359 [Dreissena polymorpha]|uniref:Uncharacterized protein n=1 Tax=Dreissena polymorpha TaxID=45954 RepID=A0A9D4DPK4_DREPO|nr:hypothetical protein DPMN_187359 [Dreissena polymorpha]